MAASDQQFTGRLVAGRFRLGARRGSGVDAAVFDAFDEDAGRVVSLHVVHPQISADPEFQRSFRHTMGRAEGLQHPNIATMYAWGSENWKGSSTLYVAVEHLDGGSLRDVLDRGRLLTPSQTLAVGLDVCKALDVIHRADLIHGDIRPSTLLFGSDRRLRVVGVGMSQLLSEVLWTDAMHVSNERAMYAAPEVAAGQPAVAASDVYSLCLTILECLTGQLPFVGDSTVSTLANRVGKLLPVSADLGPLAAVLERAGRPDPTDRSTAVGFGQALVTTAEKLPRPSPIPVLGAGMSDRGGTAEITRPLVRPDEQVDAHAHAAAPAPAPAPAPDDAPDDAPDVGGVGVGAAVPTVASDPLVAAAASITGGAPDTTSAATSQSVDPASASRGPRTDDSGALARPIGPSAPLPPPGERVAAAESRWAPSTSEPTQAIPTAPTRAEGMSPAAPGRPPTPDPTVAVPYTPPEPDPTVAMPVLRPGVAPVTVFDEEPARRRRRRLWWIIPILALLAGAGVATVLYVNRTKSHTVPALAGMSKGEAQSAVSGFGWTVDLTEEASEAAPVDQVIRTDPEGGTKLAEGKQLTIVVSTGPAPRVLPELRGLTVPEATAALTELGIKIAQGETAFDEAIPAGAVVSWSVDEVPNLVAGDTVTPGVTITVVVSKGPKPRLPELTGLTLEAATAALVGQQLTITQGDPVPDETVPIGVVVSWSVPADPTLVAGADVEPGTVVQVVLSSGPAPRTVPPLGGLAAVDAKAAVEALGLVYAELPAEFSDTVPVGAVARQDPPQDTAVPRGTTINVVLSRGPDVVAVPEITGLALQAAQDAVTAAGLSVGTVTGDAAAVVTSFTAGGQPVAAGTLLPRGTPLDITLG